MNAIAADRRDDIQPSSSLYPFSKVLVTGAAGFIGSRASSFLQGRGVKVIGLDNLYVGLPLPSETDCFVPIEADIRDAAVIEQVLERHSPEAVLHLAAVHHIPTCERLPSLAYDVNVLGTQILLDAIEKTDCVGLTMASSGAVYGWSDTALVEETSARDAMDVYSTTKLTNEYQLKTWAYRVGKRARVARLFNTIGTNDPNGHLIPDIMSQMTGAYGSQRIKLGNTAPKRDYIFVEDAARGFLEIMGDLVRDAPFDVFNLCRQEEYSVDDLVRIIGDITGNEILIENDPNRFRKIDRMSQLGDASKMKQMFGWKAQNSLRESLERIISDISITSAAAGSDISR